MKKQHPIYGRSVLWLFFLLVFLVFTFSGCHKNPPSQLCTIKGDWVAPKPLVGDSSFLWFDNKEISVAFMDDDGNMALDVIQIANEWAPYSGRTFKYTTDYEGADLRVSFASSGWWSYVGNVALTIDKSSPTLSLSHLFEYDKKTRRSVILHEFGHSLGLIHELQHPQMNIRWKKDKLYKYYDSVYKVSPGWVDSQVVDKYRSLSGIYCTPDKHSVMVYEIPKGLTEDPNFYIEEPAELSKLDKQNIQRMYNKLKCN